MPLSWKGDIKNIKRGERKLGRRSFPGRRVKGKGEEKGRGRRPLLTEVGKKGKSFFNVSGKGKRLEKKGTWRAEEEVYGPCWKGKRIAKKRERALYYISVPNPRKRGKKNITSF